MSPHTIIRAKTYEELINKSVATKLRKPVRRWARRYTPRPSKKNNKLLFKSWFVIVKKNPTEPSSMKMLRDTLLPVTQDFDRVLRWLNAVTIK